MDYSTEDQESLLKNGRIISITEPIDHNTVLRVKEALDYLRGLGAPKVTLELIGGGYVNACLSLYEILRAYPGEKEGWYYFYLDTMGFMVLLACDKREGSENAILRFAETSAEVMLSDLEDPKKLESIKQELWNYWQMVLKILVARTGYSKEEIAEWCQQRKEVGALEAKRLGFIQSIITLRG